MTETNCGKCLFEDKMDCHFPNRIGNFIDAGAYIKVENGCNVIDRSCRYFVPKDEVTFKGRPLDECARAVKEASALRMSVFIFDDNLGERTLEVAAKFSGVKNIENVSILTSKQGYYQRPAEENFSVITTYEGDKWHALDEKVKKVKPDYYMVIFDNTEFEDGEVVDGKELATLEYNVNELCKRVLAAYGDGFVIFNYEMHRMFGGNRDYCLDVKLQKHLEATEADIEFVHNWEDMELAP